MRRYLIVMSVLSLCACGSDKPSPTSPSTGGGSGSTTANIPGNYTLNIRASSVCSSLAQPGHTRSGNVAVTQSGSTMGVTMQGPVGVSTAFSATTFTGTMPGNTIQFGGGIFDTIMAAVRSATAHKARVRCQLPETRFPETSTDW